MRGKMVGVGVFLLLSLAVGLAAVGAITQASGQMSGPAYGGAALSGVTGGVTNGVTSMAVAEYGTFPGRAEPKNENAAYRAFTYV